MDNVSIKSNVEDLLFKINNNFSLLKNLSNLVKGDDSKLTASSSNMYSANINAKQLEGQITFSQIKNDLIDKLTSNDNKSSIRELLQDNNHLKNIMNITDSKNLNDLIYRINNNQISNLSLISIMKNDKEREIFKKNANRSSFENGSSDKSSPSLDDDQPNNIISKFLSSFKQKEAINKLSEDFTKLKESFNINIHEDQKDKWFNFNIPIYNEEKVQDQLISINKQSNGYIRFVIDLNLEAMGEIQLDGLIKLNAKTRNVENFDLALRFKNQLKGEIQSEIFDLFVLNQNLANLRGGLTFEQVAEFPVRSFTSDAEDRDGLSLLLQELKSQN
jgi:hypothetical protein